MFPPFSPRPGPQIDDVIGRAHHVGIVLHHQDGVAQVAQLFENADQPGRIAAMQPDGWLVQNVTGAHQPRTEARRQLDALRFAARKRRRKPVERKILQPHVVQELQPLPDFDQDLVGDGHLLGRKLERKEELLGLRDIHPRQVGQIHSG